MSDEQDLGNELTVQEAMLAGPELSLKKKRSVSVRKKQPFDTYKEGL